MGEGFVRDKGNPAILVALQQAIVDELDSHRLANAVGLDVILSRLAKNEINPILEAYGIKNLRLTVEFSNS
ncbi:hypothetical protein D3C77_422080 [compost metagenome]